MRTLRRGRTRGFELRCPNCGYDNPEGRRYCEECGEKILDLEAMKARARRRSQREAARYRREARSKGLDAEEAERRRRRARRRTSPLVGLLLLAALAALAVMLVVVATGGDSGPEKAVKEFYGAIRDKNVMLYLKHTDLELYKMAQRGEYEPDPYTEGIDYDYYALDGLKTRLVKEEGDFAEVELVGGAFKGFFNSGGDSGGIDFAQYPRTVRLVKVEGIWLVQDYQLAKLPYYYEDIGPGEPEFPEVEEGAPGPS